MTRCFERLRTAALARLRWRHAVLTLVASVACAGGGGTTHSVPDVIRAGEPSVFRLTASVWGCCGKVDGRYRGVTLHYRLVGARAYQTAPAPRRVPLDAHHERYDFLVPPYPPGTRGLLEYYFTLSFDGQPSSEILGSERVRVE